MAIGELWGVAVGTEFDDRRQLYDAGVHRALQAGIVGRASVGTESIVLSGGYVDDADYGSTIIYTGDGGRDPNTGRQVADQEFVRKNQSLVTSCLQGLPVRVVRGSGHKSEHAPDSGYRYDGLFRVDSYWRAEGKDGHFVCRFRLLSLEQDFTSSDGKPESSAETGEPVGRVETTVQRIVRDTALGRRVKELHDFTCQVCGERLECAGGPYAEAAHIRPLGTPHDGPDELENLLCLCPNHHVLLDRGALAIDDDLFVMETGKRLRLIPKHKPSPHHLRYQRSIWK
ncbi:MAG: YDG/SRA domain-containing protein [Rhodobacter sp.]|nr:YDG/SRA domain-containing protein [Rhodobacter sp.]